MFALSCLIESALGFPDSVGWHMPSLLSFTRRGFKKQSGMFDVYTGTGFFFSLESLLIVITSLESPLASLWWEAVNRRSGKTHHVEECYGSPLRRFH